MTGPTELLACPFCGGGAHRMKHSAGLQGTAGYDQWHGVSCATCNACVGARDRRFRTPAEAIAAWNRRAPQPTQPQAGAGQPVAWLDPWTGAKATTDYDAYGKHGIPLYTAPQPVERVPLPVIELMRIVMDVEQQHHFLRGTTNWATAVGRAVERAHGIKGGQHG